MFWPDLFYECEHLREILSIEAEIQDEIDTDISWSIFHYCRLYLFARSECIVAIDFIKYGLVKSLDS